MGLVGDARLDAKGREVVDDFLNRTRAIAAEVAEAAGEDDWEGDGADEYGVYGPEGGR